MFKQIKHNIRIKYIGVKFLFRKYRKTIREKIYVNNPFF
jgi:hypothetical protein